MSRRNEVVDRDHGWAAMQRRLREARSAYAKVGVLGDQEEGESGLSVGEIAAVQEFGTEDGSIPARPFVRPTFDRQREHLASLAAKLLGEVLDGHLTVDGALGVLGADLAASIRATITAGVPPPNAPSTALAKAKKGRTSRLFRSPARTVGHALAQVGALSSVKTLIDTGRMLGSVTWEVVTGRS